MWQKNLLFHKNNIQHAHHRKVVCTKPADAKQSKAKEVFTKAQAVASLPSNIEHILYKLYIINVNY